MVKSRDHKTDMMVSRLGWTHFIHDGPPDAMFYDEQTGLKLIEWRTRPPFGMDGDIGWHIMFDCWVREEVLNETRPKASRV